MKAVALKNNIARNFFNICLLSIALFLIFFEYYPMVDIPQHAAQIDLMHQLMNSEETWTKALELNYFTPYWLCYGTWFLLSLVFSIKTAFSLVLALTFVLYVKALQAIRKEFGAPKILDWFFLPAFFNFCYNFGFITFLLAIPVGILFFLYNKKKIDTNTQSFFGTLALGLILFFSHILSFIFFCFCTGIYFIYKKRIILKEILKFIPPYLPLAAVFLFFWTKEDSLQEFYIHFPQEPVWHSLSDKIDNLIKIFFQPDSDMLLRVLTAFTIASPFLLGYRPSKKIWKYIPISCFFLFWFALPEFMSGTFVVYQRYVILSIPFYFLIFECKKNDNNLKPTTHKKIDLSEAIYFIAIGFMIFLPLKDIYTFNQSMRQFSSFISQLPEGEKALSIVYDLDDTSVKNPLVHLHSFLWYQTDKNGWVDYNFAWSSAMVVRFKAESTPEVLPSFEWQHRSQIKNIKNCSVYGLILVRSTDLPPRDFLNGTSCAHEPYLRVGAWYAYRSNMQGFKNQHTF